MIVPDLFIEESLWSKNFINIVGVDEVGRGSWAGPLVVAGVILPQNFKIPAGLADSKLVSAKKRLELSGIICKTALSFEIVEIGANIIDRIGIAAATQKAFGVLVKKIKPKVDFCLVDAFHIKYLAKSAQKAVVHGDKICASIAAASIVAKVYRDRLMQELSEKYPQYGWGQNKGYGTSFHQAAIKKHGFSPLHRTSYNIKFQIA